MRIHHATAAKAEKLGIVLEAKEDLVEAIWAEGQSFKHPKAAEALAGAVLGRTFSLEYPALTISTEDDFTVVVEHKGADGETNTVYSAAEIPTLAQVLDYCEQSELDPEEGFEEGEEGSTGSVVSSHYKNEYRARGDASNCGDWLAVLMKDRFVTKTGTDIEALTHFFVINGVPMTGKWAGLPNSGQRGWQGRYRMNGRQKLEIIVLRRGTLFLTEDHQIAADEGFLAAMAAKHPDVLPEDKAEAGA